MNEGLRTLLFTIITGCAPVVTFFTCKMLQNLSKNLIAKTANEQTQKYIEEIVNIVSSAVTATNQTYVDSLKKNGEFTKEAQEEALNEALTTCINNLSDGAYQYLTNNYEDVLDYLITSIETEVKKQK